MTDTSQSPVVIKNFQDPSFPPVISPGQGNLPKEKVVMPKNSEKIPIWFWLAFLLLILLFSAITLLLVQTIRKNTVENTTKVVNTASPTPTPAPTAPFLPTRVMSQPTETTKSSMMQIKTLTSSDEISDIVADIKGTDISFFDLLIKDLDNAFGAPLVPENR